MTALTPKQEVERRRARDFVEHVVANPVMTLEFSKRKRALAKIDRLVEGAIPPTIESLRAQVVGRGHLALVMSDIATEQLEEWYRREAFRESADVVTVDHKKQVITIQKRVRR